MFSGNFTFSLTPGENITKYFESRGKGFSKPFRCQHPGAIFLNCHPTHNLEILCYRPCSLQVSLQPWMGKDCHPTFTAGNHCWSRLNNVLRGSACQREKAGCLCNFSSPRDKELEAHPRLQAIKLGFICWVWGRQPALPGGCFYHKFSSTLTLCSAFPLVFRTQLHILSGPSKSLKHIKPFNAPWLVLVIEIPLLSFWDQISSFLVMLPQFSFGRITSSSCLVHWFM